MGNLCCAREHSVKFFIQCFNTVKLHSLIYIKNQRDATWQYVH
jgi:hypothetical protein